MNKISIVDLFEYTSFDYKQIENKLFEINKYTKTRVDPNKKHITEHYGIEQSFLLYYIGYILDSKNFLEIGTGRGTTTYSLSLLKDIKKIYTFDIIPFNQKMKYAINFKEFFISNKDIFDLIPYEQKKIITFEHINNLNYEFKEKYNNYYDLAFIDGCHNNYDIIMNDFLNCNYLTKDDGVIVFDDYGNFPVVTKVVDDIIKKYDNYGYILVTFRGHLFMEDKKCNQSGEMILFKDKSKMKLFNLN